jgi:hypothetical protein
MRVPVEPTAFPSGGQTYLAYELYLTNFAGNPVGLRTIEVRDDGLLQVYPSFATLPDKSLRDSYAATLRTHLG